MSSVVGALPDGAIGIEENESRLFNTVLQAGAASPVMLWSAKWGCGGLGVCSLGSWSFKALMLV